jgi:DNA-binding HxlR family transcriptional regulator
MPREDFLDWNCSVARAMAIVGDRWTMLVLREAFFRVRRFDDFQRNLGIARNVLTDRLNRLVEHGILRRERYQERPERFEYRLTEKGLALYEPLVAILRWGDTWLADEAGPPVELVHTTCGHLAAPHLTCSHCGERLDLARVEARRPSRRASAAPPGRARRARARPVARPARPGRRGP